MKILPLMISVAASTAIAAESTALAPIDVTGDAQGMFALNTDSNRTNGSESFGAESIQTLGTQANMNPYTVIQYSPSVNFTPVDQAGSNEPSFHDPIRIRGKSQSGPGGVFMISSTPISSNPGGGKEMVDMENIASIDLYKGYIPVDKNLGFSSLIGKVDINPLAPQESAGGEFAQSFGSNSLKRTFLRMDSGDMGDIKVYGSASYLENDKFKGAGDLTRKNGSLGVSYEPSEKLKVELFTYQNDDKHHNYYNMSYAEATNLDTFKDKDFATTKPTKENDVNYYDWNKQSFRTNNTLGTISYRPTDSDLITVKPYYKNDNGEYWYSQKGKDGNTTKNRVIEWSMDHDLYGVVAAYDHTFSDLLATKIGYWYHKQLPPGPPSDQKKYKSVNGNLVYDGYAILSENDYHILQAPFAQASGKKENFNYVVGVQYQSFELGSLQSHTVGSQNAKTSADYDLAIASSPVDPWASVDAKTFHTLVPSLYLGYDAKEDTTLYIDYARTYGFDVNLFPTYVSNRENFVKKNVTLEQLWDTLDLELSDNIDFGVKTVVGGITLNPSLFVSKVQNKQANIYDPRFGVTYPANVGDALGYGAEFAAYGSISEDLEFLGSLSYNQYHFTQDFQTSPNTSVHIEGNQLPDAPEFLAKAAFAYHLDNWTLTPSARYTSSRWGDVSNTEKIEGYTLFDLDVAYHMSQFLGFKDTFVRLTATNITNKDYIATINAPDNILVASQNSSTYQNGAPFGIYGSIDLKF